MTPPPVEAANRVAQLVDTPDRLARFQESVLPRVENADIALDIEEDREWRFTPRVALIQLTLDDEDWILDPVALSIDALATTVEALLLTPRQVIMHGARNDVGGLKRDWGVGPERVRDTQIAAQLLGLTAFGLAALVERHFGIALDKSERRSDWVRRPLSPAQVEYARRDTAWLIPLWHELEARVIDAGWHDALLEECDVLRDLPADRVVFDPDGWTRVKGIGELDDPARARLAWIWRWRFDEGRRTERHPSKILPPWALIELAKRNPEQPRRQSPPWLPDTFGPAEFGALADLPPRPDTTPQRPRRLPFDPSFAETLDRLMTWRAGESARTGLDAGFLAPRGVLELVARREFRSIEDLEQTPEIRRWRATRYFDAWWEACHPPRSNAGR